MSRRSALRVFAFLSCLAGAACGGSTPPPPAAEKITPTVVGEMSPEEAGGMAPAPEAEGGHEHVAPHGGALVELGEEFAHIELVHDAASGALTAYVLDGEAEQAVRVTLPALELDITPAGGAATTVSLAAKANALTGESVGDSSQFVATVAALKGVTRFTGVVRQVTVRGQAFSTVAFSVPAEEH